MGKQKVRKEKVQDRAVGAGPMVQSSDVTIYIYVGSALGR
jgi:hypothetical protein